MRRWNRSAQLLAIAVCVLTSLALSGVISKTDAQEPGADSVAPEPGIMAPGQAAVTSFGGYLNPPNDEGMQEDRTLDPDGIVLRLVDLGEADGIWSADILSPTPLRSYTASQLGQVFGLAFDDAANPNIYVTATSLYGLRREGTGSDAEWADGQFGSGDNAGPGTIWKIDGTTGEVSLFANVERDGVPNTGPALGNIAFDPVSQQLFVSDRDTGLIHRFDLDGQDRGQFDHGVAARPSTGVSEEPFDLENRLDIGGNAFDPDNPRTWAYAPEARSVFGLAVNGGRLYYAASEGPQIWSVGIGSDGAFEDDPRLEFDVPLEFANGEITDIAFTADRKIVLAQRGRQIVSDDGLRFHSEGNAAVFAFVPESPDDPETPGRWVEEHQSLSIGYFEPYKMGSGGVSIGHGYTEDGDISGAACKASIWVTGDQLGNAGEEAEPVEGLQGQPMSRLRTETGLPEQITTFSIDSAPNGFGASGFLGDVEAFIRCDGQLVADLDPYEPPVCPSDDPRCLPPIEVVEPPIDPEIVVPPPPPGPDLVIAKVGPVGRCFRGEDCRFTVMVRNLGDADYYGPVTFEDQTSSNEPLTGYGPTDTWQCAEGDYLAAFCRHEDVHLAPGDGIGVELSLPIPEDWTQPVFENCAKLSFMPWQVGADTNSSNNRACAIAPVCQPGEPGCGPEMALSQNTTGYCETEGLCRLTTRITNRGGEPFEGSLAFQIDDFSEGLNLQTYTPIEAWSCGPNGVGNYRCFSNPLVLEPGEFAEVSVTLALPDDYASDEAHQCAALTWPAGSGDANVFNDRDCATFNICRGGDCPAELAATTAQWTYCRRNEPCLLVAGLENIGGQVFGNPGERLTLEMTAEGATQTPLDAAEQGACPEEQLDGATRFCTNTLENGLLPRYLNVPPSSVFNAGYFDVSNLPATQTTLEACAQIAFSEDQSDPDPSNNKHCITIQICEEDGCEADFAAWMRAPRICYRGQTCDLRALVHYSGEDASEDIGFSSSINTLGGLAADSAQLSYSNSATNDWINDGVCTVGSENVVCDRSIRPMDDAPGQRWRVEMPTAIPADEPLGPREICVELTDITGSNPNPSNDRVCDEVMIEDPPEALADAAGVTTEGLAISKRLLGACRDPGAECTFRHRLINNGTEPFEGELSLRDTLQPGGSELVGSAGQWICSQADGQPIDCARGDLRLGPGEAEAFDITLQIPPDANGALENCAELTGENVPANEADARSCVTVAIDGEVAPPPPPPPPPEPEPEPEPEPQRSRDLSLTTGGQSGCTSGNLCPVGFVIRNAGEVTYEQALTVRHTLRPLTGGLRLSRLSGNHNGYSCSGSSSGGTCTNPSERLTPGSSNVFSAAVTATAPANGRPSSFEICGTIDWDGAGLATTNAGVRQAQARLNELGFNAGAVDGLAGRQTARAVTAYQQANGLPTTGQLDAATYARLVGVPDNWNDDNPGNDAQCTTIQLPAVAAPPPPPTCTGGRFWNGRACVCNPGLQFRNGRCRPIITDPGPCSISGQFRNNRGQCVCPVGTSVQRGACRPIDTGPAPCSIPGQIRLRGQCVCPSGQQVIRGRCRVPARACTADKILRNGECVCPTGMTLQNGICQPPGHGRQPPPQNRIPDQLRGNCPANHIQILGNCVPVQ